MPQTLTSDKPSLFYCSCTYADAFSIAAIGEDRIKKKTKKRKIRRWESLEHGGVHQQVECARGSHCRGGHQQRCGWYGRAPSANVHTDWSPNPTQGSWGVTGQGQGPGPPVDLKIRKSDLVFDEKILRVELEDVVCKYVIHKEKRIVIWLMSSTFTDNESEYNLLITDVVTYLHEYVRQHDFEFRLVEIRWGIREETTLVVSSSTH